MDDMPTDISARPSRRRQRAPGAPQFVLRFPVEMIPALAAAHVEDDDERRAFAAGRRIAAGSRARDDFMSIFEWKTRGRGRSRPARNSDVEIRDALDLAMAARTERSAIAVLSGLVGVDVPVASAVMTAIDPARYTILDFRALWSLGVEQNSPYYPIPYFLDYLTTCRQIAAETGTSLRDLDRALWGYSKRNQRRPGAIRGPSEAPWPV
ncbi:hypothetical protein [Bradyrhizobium japonicum]|uniref:hypothetical protein n=1 Tax=Bradyrhizobium japonicum TaxID=375 RepID=UPI0004160C85|nr:hypothetical protein [Bradyrhizobium japonicum]